MRLTASVCALVLITSGTMAAAASDAEKCEASKNKIAGKYAFCRLKAEAKAIKKGAPPDYTKCDANYEEKWMKGETKAGGMCPTLGDSAAIRGQVTADSDLIALKLTGVRFVDNGDGTVTDVETLLMWEKKDDLGEIHDKDNVYQWCVDDDLSGCDHGLIPDGTVFTTFLGTLNHGTSVGGSTTSGCFAGHCDWRLPTNEELQTILLAPSPCATHPCIDPIFGPTQSFFYWSNTTWASGPLPFGVDFNDGTLSLLNGGSLYFGRAVRGGS